MLDNKVKKCLTCGKPFTQKSKRHLFHNRECFRKYYWKNVEKEKNINPTFRCPSCGEEEKLNFNPKKNYSLFMSFRCKKCGKKNIEE